jgi:hypothetical protein
MLSLNILERLDESSLGQLADSRKNRVGGPVGVCVLVVLSLPSPIARSWLPVVRWHSAMFRVAPVISTTLVQEVQPRVAQLQDATNVLSALHLSNVPSIHVSLLPLHVMCLHHR